MRFLIRVAFVVFGLLIILFSSTVYLWHRIYPVAPSSWILFESDRDGNSTNLYQMRTDGSAVRTMTQHQGIVTMPTWSPDSKRIAYQLRHRNSFEVYVIDTDNGSERTIADLSARPARSLEWSPRGDWIVFSAYRGGVYRLYRMRPDGSQIDFIASIPLVNEQSYFWSPDGEWIALFSPDKQDLKADLYRVRVDGSGLQHLTDVNSSAATLSVGWSPDSQWISFTGYADKKASFYRMPASGGTVQNLTPEPLSLQGLYRPAWSPDGQWIAFLSFREYIFDVHIMRTDGSDLQRVTSLAVGNAFEDLTWSPDSKWLIFRAYQNGNSHSNILRIRPDGTGLEHLTSSFAYDDDPVTSPPIHVRSRPMSALLLGLCSVVVGMAVRPQHNDHRASA